MDEEEDGRSAADIRYKDFFLPPPRAPKPKGKPPGPTGKGKAKAVEPPVTEKAETPKKAGEEGTLSRRPSVRFHDQVKVRRIKARKQDPLKITPEMLAAIGAGGEDAQEMMNKWAEFSQDGDESDEEGEEEFDEEAEEDEEGSEEEEASDAEASEDEEGDAFMDEGDSADEETAQRVTGDLFADEPAATSSECLCINVCPLR